MVISSRRCRTCAWRATDYGKSPCGSSSPEGASRTTSGADGQLWMEALLPAAPGEIAVTLEWRGAATAGRAGATGARGALASRQRERRFDEAHEARPWAVIIIVVGTVTRRWASIVVIAAVARRLVVSTPVVTAPVVLSGAVAGIKGLGLRRSSHKQAERGNGKDPHVSSSPSIIDRRDKRPAKLRVARPARRHSLRRRLRQRAPPLRPYDGPIGGKAGRIGEHSRKMVLVQADGLPQRRRIDRCSPGGSAMRSTGSRLDRSCSSDDPLPGDVGGAGDNGSGEFLVAAPADRYRAVGPPCHRSPVQSDEFGAPA